MALLHHSQIYISFLLENDSRLYGSTYSIAGMLDSYRVLVCGVTLQGTCFTSPEKGAMHVLILNSVSTCPLSTYEYD